MLFLQHSRTNAMVIGTAAHPLLVTADTYTDAHAEGVDLTSTWVLCRPKWNIQAGKLELLHEY